MSWKEEIKKAPFLDIDVSDLKKVKANVEHALTMLSYDTWEETLPDLLKPTYRSAIKALNDAKLVLDGMQE